ncbi:hypothetical protein U9M48_023030 [Paspalum notatum var. saurae]|uniref:Pentatricopeptide repeat-containing protein n=1 Tax=Paspalum notatum var. saurae TaxID=547442 RepID=A0AAQ3TNJ9_PASNO
MLSWNTLISGFGKHGHARAAIAAFERMKESGTAPDSITFTGLLAACSHAGLVSQGAEYLAAMSAAYGVPPRAEHVACVVDLLGRAGRLEEAEGHVVASALQDDAVVLGGLLSACRVHGDAGAGERVSRRLLALVGLRTSSPHVLLSHLYASGGRWDGAAAARRMAMRKDAGRSALRSVSDDK